MVGVRVGGCETFSRRHAPCQSSACLRLLPIRCHAPDSCSRPRATSGRTIAEPVARFWYTSGLIPLLAEEPARATLLIRLEQDPQMLVCWGTRLEIVSALARREREGVVAPGGIEPARSAAADLIGMWHEVVPSDLIRRAAERLVCTHPLCAAASLRLGRPRGRHRPRIPRRWSWFASISGSPPPPGARDFRSSIAERNAQ